MNELHKMLTLLHSNVLHRAQTNPVVELAYLRHWLDPVGNLSDDIWDYAMNEDETGLVMAALSIFRTVNPLIYAGTLQLMRGHKKPTFRAIDNYICQEFQRHYPYLRLSSLYEMNYGVPIDFIGFDLTTIETFNGRESYQWVLNALFNIDFEHGEDIFEQLEGAYKTSRQLCLAFSFLNRQPFIELYYLLSYLFSSTGNSTCDYTHDEWWESGFDALHWEIYWVEFANEVHEEADLISSTADRAIRLLQRHEDLRNLLIANIKSMQKGTSYERLDWTIHWNHNARCDPAWRTTDNDSLIRLWNNHGASN